MKFVKYLRGDLEITLGVFKEKFLFPDENGWSITFFGFECGPSCLPLENACPIERRGVADTLITLLTCVDDF